jgi:hypothetical protein
MGEPRRPTPSEGQTPPETPAVQVATGPQADPHAPGAPTPPTDLGTAVAPEVQADMELQATALNLAQQAKLVGVAPTFGEALRVASEALAKAPPSLTLSGVRFPNAPTAEEARRRLLAMAIEQHLMDRLGGGEQLTVEEAQMVRQEAANIAERAAVAGMRSERLAGEREAGRRTVALQEERRAQAVRSLEAGEIFNPDVVQAMSVALLSVLEKVMSGVAQRRSLPADQPALAAGVQALGSDVTYHDRTLDMEGIEGGRPRLRYHPTERALRPEDILSSKDYGTHVVYVTTDGQKVRVDK